MQQRVITRVPVFAFAWGLIVVAAAIYLFSFNNPTSTHIDRQANGICLGQIILVYQ